MQIGSQVKAGESFAKIIVYFTQHVNLDPYKSLIKPEQQ